MENDVKVYKEALKKAADKINELSEELKKAAIIDDIAVIGYSCRFPKGADNPEKFWELLTEGFDAVTEIGADRFPIEKYYSEKNEEKGKSFTRYASLLDTDIKSFDYSHFEISAKEAASIDPQQKLLLEVSWEALENSGLAIDKLRGSKTGVFIGIDSLEYFQTEVFSGDTKDITPYSLMGVSQHSAAGRLSYFYDFKGPAVSLNTACSSSLVALNAAAESLRNGQCDLAVVGGVNLLLTPSSFVGLSQFNALSADGRCKTFDASADGFGRGEGCGVILLKLLKDARRDGNMVEALVKGIGIGQDGKSNGFYAPNGLAEQSVLKQALKSARLTPDDIDYIEAHGTGTSLGDTIEALTISEVYKKKQPPIYVGAVKSNMGHLEAASGMASLLKVLLSLKYKKLPPSIHCNNPNPNIDWEKIRIVRVLTDWTKKEGKRRAGISSFGISGTLAHVILEEAKGEEAEEKGDKGLNPMPLHLLTLSAKSINALKESIYNVQEKFSDEGQVIQDITYSSNITRSSLKYRFALVGETKENFLDDIKDVLSKEEVFLYHRGKVTEQKNKIAFLFTGQGSIYKNAAKQLYDNSSVFREAFESCEEKFMELLGISVKEALYKEKEEYLTRPLYSQPVIFTIEYALTKVWEIFGVKPDVVIGHSIGEYAMACFAGLLHFEDAVKMIAIRAKMMEAVDLNGKMVGVLTDRETVERAIKESGCREVSIAAVNASKNITLSGIHSEVDRVIEELQKKERVFVNDLRITKPYHSSLMEPYEEMYGESLDGVCFYEPAVNIISTVTGRQENVGVLGNKKYWAKHLSKTVDFHEAMKEAEKQGINIFIEIGGNGTLSGLAGQSIQENAIFLPSLRNGVHDYRQLLEAVKSLYLHGVDLDFDSFYKTYEKKKVLLPNYPFQRKESWKETKVVSLVNGTERRDSMIAYEEKKNLLDIKTELRDMIHMITGLDGDDIEQDKELFSLGFDSLLLMSLSKQIRSKYNLDIPLDIFFTSLNTLDKVSGYISDNGRFHEEETATVSLEAAEDSRISDYGETKVFFAEGAGRSDFSLLQHLFENQFKIMAEQNEIIKGITGTESRLVTNTDIKTVKKEVKTREVSANKAQENYYIPYHRLHLTEETPLQELQKDYVNDIIAKYTSLTKGSKARTQKYRSVNANARNTGGFRPLFKEMVYQVIAQKGEGSRFIDIDGNEFIDITMGFGVNLFGHAPAFVREALMQEINNGMPIGPMGRLPGEVARQISELTGAERVFFCNSGTEADMFAVRLARAVTGRNKIVCFTGAYHGTYDGLLGLPDYKEDGTISALPQAPGLTENGVKDLILLSYDNEKSLRYIAAHKEEIAGVLVETVQSRRPDVQPAEFLKKLRKLTEENDIALIFDEVITGFRIASGGAQEYFGIQADIVTYGKVAGGGMPIGIIAGKAKYLDSVDGGMWCYGDDSVPPCEEKRSLVTGTFCHHPMAMAAANAVLKHIRANKETLYKELNDKTERFINRINSFFEMENIPFKAVHFGSLFRFNIAREHEIFYYGLVEKGIYIWEGRNCFLSTEHSEEDIQKIIEAITLTVYEMKEAGYFGKPTDPPSGKHLKNFLKGDTKQVTAFEEGKSFSMSMIQKRLYSQMLITGQDPFDMFAVYFIRSDIRKDILEQAVNQIIGRHEILRTAMYLEEGEYKQKVLTSWNFQIKEIEQKEDCNLNDLISASVCKFDLSQPPLVEILLINLPENQRAIVFHFHHTASDGMSMSIFVRELISLYNNQPLAAVKKQYGDFVLWENQYLESRTLSADKEYWLDRLNGVSCFVPLSYDFPGKSDSDYEGHTIIDRLDKVKLNGLKDIAKQQGVSLFMLLLSAVNILLHRITEEREIAVLTPVSGRFDGEFEENIGMFTNTIALSSRIEDSMNFDVYLQEIKKDCLKSYSHVNYPFNLLVNELKASGKNPFNVMFVYENTDSRTLKINNAELEEFEYIPGAQEFDITFELLEKDGELGIFFRYRKALFTEESIKRLLGRFLLVMDQILEFPETRFSDIEIVSEEEKEEVVGFNHALVDYPREKTVVDLFEEQAQKCADRISVVFEKEELTYDALNRMGNIIAERLKQSGVGPDDFVAVLAERSTEMIGGILGVLKAGGAYVPIDPSYPKDRISYILKDCKPKAVLYYKAEPVTENDIPCINLEDIKNTEGSFENPEHINNPEDLAYLIYTSGTTGNPKGVMVEQRNLVRLLFNEAFQFDFNEKDVWMMFHSYCFDFSVWEIFGALLYGGRLVVLSRETVKDSLAVAGQIKKHQITVLNQVPTAFYSLLPSDDGVSMKSVRYLIFGGEALNPARLKEWHRTYSQAKIINMYGITETTVHVTYREIGDEEIEKGISDIGNAIPTLSAYVLRKNQICGIGMPGELCVAGAGLARGYLNREELNCEKFTKNPVGEGKIYRSGDLVRWLSDGNLEYLGRIDEQVKIRGYRIELGEIENALREVPYIKDAAVLTRTDNSGESAIYSYLVSDEEIDITDLKSRIGSFLPEYMIPAYMLQIDEIPVTKNGKLDKKALPGIESKRKLEYKAPENELEEKICGIFEEVLSLKSVGTEDNFFEIGGHSLRVTRALNRIEAETGVKLPVRTIFQFPTAKELSKIIEAKKGKEYEAIPKAEVLEYYPMSSAQKRIYLIWQMDKQGISYNMTQCYRLAGEVKIENIKSAFQEILNRHEILRTDFCVINGELMQRVHSFAKLDFTYREVRAEEYQKLIKEFVRPFNLEEAPLFRIQVVKQKNGYLLVFDMHHIAGDGMSLGIITKEFTELYEGNKLQPLKYQYKDYSQWMNGRNLSQAKEYWLKEFQDEIPVLDMPLDFNRPPVQSYKGDVVRISTGTNLADGIKSLARREEATEFMVFLSASMILLSKYSRQQDIIIGSPISGRTHRDMEGMLGMFVNTLALRGKPEADKSYKEFLEEIKDTCLKAYENQEYPFEELIESIAVKRDMSRNPLFDVMLALQNNEESRFVLNGTEFYPVGQDNAAAKFDLTFNIIEEKDGYCIELEYCSDLFCRDSAKRMLALYLFLLEQVTRDQTMKIGGMETAEKAEKERILGEFNDTATDYPKKTVVQLFEEQAANHSDKVAVILEDQSITYGELNEKANILAHKLRSLGIKPGDFVGVLGDKSIELVTGILAVVKAGGAYVPIDKAYPKERIEYILEDCHSKAVLIFNVSLDSELPVIDLKKPETWEGNGSNPQLWNDREDLIYVIYTSGTTGQPKGTMVENKSVIRLVRNTNYVTLNEDTVILQTGVISFDASTFEIWGALLNGGQVCLAGEEVLTNPENLRKVIQKQKINTLFITTVLFNQMVSFDRSMFSPLKYLMFGGEKTSEEYVRDFLECKENEKVIFSNVYGPTEATTFSTYYRINPVRQHHRTPIGKSISNSCAYILDNGKLCGIGVPGELCLAGDGIARGYLNRTELSADKFTDNPFGEGRLYRSGDLVRWLSDGNIEFMGRIDEQVKIRGFRIEPAEIESHLRSIEGIQDAAVLVKEDGRGDKAIYGYLVSDGEIIIGHIREILSKTLPEYMIPSYMMQIDALPVTRNGKLDKRALPQIDTKSTKEFIKPRNEAENILCSVFSEILGVAKVGIEDNFFELGGDSIKAIRIVSKMREAGYELLFKEIMNNHSIGEVAGSLLLAEKQEYEQGEVWGSVKSTPVLQEFEDWNLAKPEHFNQAVMMKTDIREEKLIKKILSALMKHHDALRAVYRDKRLEILPVKESGLFDLITFSFKKDENVHIKVEQECNKIQMSMDLWNGPLVKGAFFKTIQGNYLFLCIHHLIIDGVSWRILLEDFQTVKKQLERGREVKLPAKTASFSQWGEALEEYKNSPMLKKEYDYWSGVCGNMQTPELKTAEDGMGHGYERKEIVFSEEETCNLLYKSGTAFHTEINDLLLSALGMSVRRLTGQRDILINLEGHGRENIHKKIAIDRTVGWFTSMYPVLLTPCDAWEDTIIATKEMLRKVPNHGIGYGLLKGSLPRVSFDISFNFLGEIKSDGEEMVDNEFSTGVSIAEENQLTGKINFDGIIVNGALSFTLTYDKSSYSENVMNRFAALFKGCLTEMISFCLQQEEGKKTVSDFEAPSLNAAELEEIESLFQ